MTNIARYFVVQTRDDGTNYTTHTDDAPEWLTDAVYDAHDDELPNDWRYEHCRFIARAIDEGDDDAMEIADGLVDTYTMDLLAWVSDYTGRSAYVDEAVDDQGWRDLESAIRSGQFLCLMNMAQVLIDAVNENTYDEDED